MTNTPYVDIFNIVAAVKHIKLNNPHVSHLTLEDLKLKILDDINEIAGRDKFSYIARYGWYIIKDRTGVVQVLVIPQLDASHYVEVEGLSL